jgi:hypothetical protein
MSEKDSNRTRTITMDAPQKSNNSKSTQKIIISAVLITFSIIYLSMYGCGSQNKVSMHRFVASGEILGEETAKLIGKKGKVILIATDVGQLKADAFKLQLNTLTSSLKKNGIEVSAIEYAEVQENEETGVVGVPSRFFTGVIQKYPGAAAIISLAGPPLLSKGTHLDLGESKLIVFSLYNSNQIEQMLTDKIVQLAVVPNPNQKKLESSQPKTTRDWFDHFYIILQQGP